MENVIQECLCSLSLAEECPAHPFRAKRARKPKPSRQALKKGQCAACVFIKEVEHDNGKHPLYLSEIKAALEIGPVFCRVPTLTDAPLLVRGVGNEDGVTKVEVLEGHFSGVQDIWMVA